MHFSGPAAIHQNRDYQYQCKVEGGKPSPDIRWHVKDHLGNSKDVVGERVEEGVSQMLLRTDDADRKIEITCAAENPSGKASHTISIHMHCKISKDV